MPLGEQPPSADINFYVQLFKVLDQLWPRASCPQPFTKMGDQTSEGDCFVFGDTCLRNNDGRPFIQLNIGSMSDVPTLMLAVSYAATTNPDDASRLRDQARWSAGRREGCANPALADIGVSLSRSELFIARCDWLKQTPSWW